jgi:hypothetical protein
MMERTQWVEFVQPGVPCFRPGFAVVVFQPTPIAALRCAHRCRPRERDTLRCVRPAAQVGDIQDVDTAGDDQVQHRVAEQFASPPGRNRAHAIDLAHFAPSDFAAEQGFQVDPDQRPITRRDSPPLCRRRAWTFRRLAGA